ncbi:MAG: 2-oxo acid dehydrogenase subunit E2, partial [Chloroflexi bacterium]|nr:2-oxo acid dehydrogenase subunit E2 [Chloroflexota bacterium]
MAEIIPMPKLGFDMAEGTLVRKAKQEGEAVAKGDVLADIETDKTTIEVESYAGGILKAWLIDVGQPVPIGTPMVVIAAPGEEVDVAALRAAQPAAAPAPAAPVGAASPAPTAESGALRISPIARRMADERGIDPRQIKGTGPEGRITKKDIEALTAPSASAVSPVVALSREDSTVALTKLRSAISRRMTESKTSVPHFYITSDVDMDAAMTLRAQLNALLGDAGKLSVNDFIVKAVALTLREFPNLNAALKGDSVARHGHVNVGMAVAVPGGLMTVVVKDADVKSLAQIAADSKAMVARARDGKIKPEDVDGSTFTVSNLGMYEVDSFTAIINPPEAAILAVGSVMKVPVVKGDA